MALRFTCPGCQALFTVDDRLAGRSARCKKCGASLKIPKTTTAAPTARVLSPTIRVPTTAGLGDQPRPGSQSSSWIDAVTTHVALAPISEQHLPPIKPLLDSALTEQQFPLGPDNLDTTGMPPNTQLPHPEVTAGSSPSFDRTRLQNLLKALRWINQTAYLISLPFIMIFLFGVVTKLAAFTALGATAALLLNVGRLAVGLANLVAVPFRDGLEQGLLFLLPPWTITYMLNHWDKVREPAARVIGPLITIALIILVFTFTP